LNSIDSETAASDPRVKAVFSRINNKITEKHVLIELIKGLTLY